MRELMIFLHLTGVVVWVGGMFFAHHCLRPAALGRFFGFVTGALLLLWSSGLAMMLQSGFGGAPVAWHAMMGVALVMTAIFAVIRLLRYPRLRAGVAAGDWPAAGAALNGIRILVVVNLGLGWLTIAIATLGRLL